LARYLCDAILSSSAAVVRVQPVPWLKGSLRSESTTHSTRVVAVKDGELGPGNSPPIFGWAGCFFCALPTCEGTGQATPKIGRMAPAVSGLKARCDGPSPLLVFSQLFTNSFTNTPDER